MSTNSTSELPAIRLPKEPLPPEWAATVEQLIERAKVVEEWATESRQRAVLSVTLAENAVLDVHELLDNCKTEQAVEAVSKAAADIRARRAGLH